MMRARKIEWKKDIKHVRTSFNVSTNKFLHFHCYNAVSGEREEYRFFNSDSAGHNKPATSISAIDLSSLISFYYERKI